MSERRRDLRPLFAPRSVAVVGASADPAKWGNILARGALRGSRRRRVFLVNRAGGKILGERAYSSLAELPEAPELAVLAVPAGAFESAADEALAAGARAIVAISAGFGEQSGEGKKLEARVAERVRAAGAVMLGPNCLGVFDAGQELDVGWSELPSGPIGLVSQSGNLALELARLADRVGLGFSRFASLGNQADLVAADLLEELASHDATRVVALYVEDFRDGRAFVEAAARATAAGTPVILLAGGTAPASARAAVSHTGALVSGERAVEAACRAAGIARVRTPKELIDAAQALLSERIPRGRRVAVYADGGGHGVIAVDLLARAGLDVAALSENTMAALRAELPRTSSVANPVDFAGGGERGLDSYADVGRLLLGAEEVDSVLLTGYFGGYGVDTPEVADAELAAARSLAAAAHESGNALVVHTSFPESTAAVELRRGALPVYGDVESAVAALALLTRRLRDAQTTPSVDDAVPALAPPEPTYFAARAFLEEVGVPLVGARAVHTRAEALAAADELAYPVALKAVDSLHKSESRGVVLGLSDAEALTRAFDDLERRLAPGELSVERMAPLADGVELVVGCKRDPRFGAVVLVGLGGLYTEVLDDVAVALAPVGEEEAARLVRELRGAPLLDGARGTPRLDIVAAARAISALSTAAAACPEIAELEVNPLLVLPDGVLGLDARVVLRS